jgi:hypothetical protein
VDTTGYQIYMSVIYDGMLQLMADGASVYNPVIFSRRDVLNSSTLPSIDDDPTVEGDELIGGGISNWLKQASSLARRYGPKALSVAEQAAQVASILGVPGAGAAQAALEKVDEARKVFGGGAVGGGLIEDVSREVKKKALKAVSAAVGGAAVGGGRVRRSLIRDAVHELASELD